MQIVLVWHRIMCGASSRKDYTTGDGGRNHLVPAKPARRFFASLRGANLVKFGTSYENHFHYARNHCQARHHTGRIRADQKNSRPRTEHHGTRNFFRDVVGAWEGFALKSAQMRIAINNMPQPRVLLTSHPEKDEKRRKKPSGIVPVFKKNGVFCLALFSHKPCLLHCPV